MSIHLSLFRYSSLPQVLWSGWHAGRERTALSAAKPATVGPEKTTLPAVPLLLACARVPPPPPLPFVPSVILCHDMCCDAQTSQNNLSTSHTTLPC
ncbi:hypothetical protein LZ32DRAFT_179487 [Colletotrichum eremochloae]|nr:hypothetical protein LZ32DRAFT_179487 [Colletotrichum eremochloae]